MTTPTHTPGRLSKDEIAHLELFDEETYAICLGAIGHKMQAKGLVEWVPPIWGNEPNWTITETGRAALSKALGEDG